MNLKCTRCPRTDEQISWPRLNSAQGCLSFIKWARAGNFQVKFLQICFQNILASKDVFHTNNRSNGRFVFELFNFRLQERDPVVCWEEHKQTCLCLIRNCVYINSYGEFLGQHFEFAKKPKDIWYIFFHFALWNYRKLLKNLYDETATAHWLKDSHASCWITRMQNYHQAAIELALKNIARCRIFILNTSISNKKQETPHLTYRKTKDRWKEYTLVFSSTHQFSFYGRFFSMQKRWLCNLTWHVTPQMIE